MMSEQECKLHGEHCWNYHAANDVVDKYGNHTGQQHLVYYPAGEPQLRTCKHCGKREILVQRWEDVNGS